MDALFTQLKPSKAKKREAIVVLDGLHLFCYVFLLLMNGAYLINVLIFCLIIISSDQCFPLVATLCTRLFFLHFHSATC